MSYPSCIKMPVSKSEILTDNECTVFNEPESNVGTYNELILIANEVFGHGKWSHAVTSQTVDFVEYVMGKYHIGCAAFVKVQLPDGTYHEEMGYSNAESSVKGSAVYSARVSSITNALKKALLCFGGIIEEKIVKILSNTNRRKMIKLHNGENYSDRLKSDISKNSKSLTTSSVANSAGKRPISPTGEDKTQIKKSVTTELPVKIGDSKPVVNPKSVPSTSTNSPQISKSSLRTNNNDNVVSQHMSEEELQRLERKRKQREKQEEYRKMMKERVAKGEDKT